MTAREPGTMYPAPPRVPDPFSSGITSEWPLPWNCWQCCWVHGSDGLWHLKQAHVDCKADHGGHEWDEAAA